MSQFSEYAVKPDSVRAVKLTESNIKDVGAEILKKVQRVEVDDVGLTVQQGARDVTLRLGRWIIEEWNYVVGSSTYRPASLAERQKYDLR